MKDVKQWFRVFFQNWLIQLVTCDVKPLSCPHIKANSYNPANVAKAVEIDVPGVVRWEQFFTSWLIKKQCECVTLSASVFFDGFLIVRNMKSFTYSWLLKVKPGMKKITNDNHDRRLFMGQRKARIESHRSSALNRWMSTSNTVPTFGLELFFENVPEISGKQTSRPTTVGPNPEKVTF